MSHLSAFSPRAMLLFVFFLPAVASAAIWQDVETATAQRAADAEPVYYRALRANTDALKQALVAAPLEFTSSQGAELLLPMPDGSLQRFEVENSPIMAPELAARYPEIQTYRVKGIDNPGAGGRLDLTPAGFHGMISTSAGTVFIDPDGMGGYRSYYKQDYILAKKGMGSLPAAQCAVEGESRVAARTAGEVALRTSGQRRVYRLAVAATGEYTQFHGGTVSEGLAAIVTAINRVNQIYGRDVAIQFVLVAANDSVIFTNPATDPYTNSSGITMLTENQSTLDAFIGSANYDIGHVFSTGGGGIASVGVTCTDPFKAQGVTGSPNPVGDSFYIDLVAHEIGHQLDADHPFNGTTNSCSSGRFAGSNVEPGSGSTIMSYAGICGGENLQNSSDATFHAWNIRQIVNYSSTSGACGATVATGNTAPLNVSAGPDFTIPANTPFFLQGSATDAEGDTLSYQWDEMDANGTATNSSTLGTDLGDNPLFRSFLPKDTALRILPRLSSLLAGITDKGETLPATNRALNFRLTVRDGESGVDEDDVVVSVVNSAVPFAVIEPVDSGLANGLQLPVSWTIAGTNAPTINCANVDIHLLTFNSNKSSYCENVLALATPNDGSQPVILQDNHGTSRGRVRVQCSNNIFFDINNSDLVVNAPTPANTDCISTDGALLEHGTVFNDAGGGSVGGVLASSDGGGGGALLFLPLLLGLGWAGRGVLIKCQGPA